MMYFDPYLAQRLAEKHIRDRLREAEQYRLIRTAQGPRKVRGMVEIAGVDAQQSGGPHRATAKLMGGDQVVYRFEIDVIAEI